MLNVPKNMMSPQTIVSGADLEKATPDYTMLVSGIPRVGRRLRGSRCRISQNPDGSVYLSEGEAWQTSTIQQVKILDISDDKSLAHYRVATRNSVIQVIVNLKF